MSRDLMLYPRSEATTSDSPARTARGEEERGPDLRVRLRDDARLVTLAEAPSFAAEQYRGLAFQVAERLNPIGTWGYALTVTSPEQGSGKTLTCLNLALALARGEERRVLLAEGDLWRPQLHNYLEPSPPVGRGLLQVLERRLELGEAVMRVAGTTLDVLVAGVEEVAGDVMSGRRMSEVLSEMRGAYEVVIIDSPPIGLLASARSLASRADGVLMVVRSGQSQRKAIERSLSSLSPEKVVGMVFNDARVARRGSRGYYD
ncbi:MAG TPA: CpsD/CapB family tyrosine-protein kinase [Thermoanaerobaculia bacterium]|nr:CpsD/CapB family tyrosine-protein kinase [Thermoanaerobaculia bacterium]